MNVSQYYNDSKKYSWTEASLQGKLEPMDLARLMTFRENLSHYTGSNKKLLDIGCGSGVFSQVAYDLGFQVTGIDISRKALSILKKRYPGIEFKYCRAEKLFFNARSFDVVLCLETLEHLPYPEMALKQIHRVLSDQGVCLLSVPNWFAWDRLMANPLTSSGYKMIRQLIRRFNPHAFSAHLHFHSPSEWERIFKKYGFKVIYSRPVYIFPFFPSFNNILGFAKKMERCFFSFPGVLSFQQAVEKSVLNLWPFSDLGQSHFWILGKRLIK